MQKGSEIFYTRRLALAVISHYQDRDTYGSANIKLKYTANI